eukprot:GEMP01048445.1.p1 GENE.GEMP01048445.1~~GEMP01048445.1.p1  ORF type:complete len:395 (+),score=67.71 GEMP01048445.1:42-1226(+)
MAFLSLIGFFGLIEKTHGFITRRALHINSEAKQGSLSVFTTTWNMGDQDGSDIDAVSDDTLKQWLFPDPDENEKRECADIFIIATEEQRIPASKTVLRTTNTLDTNHDEWVDRVSSFLNAECKVQLNKLDEFIGATSLMVFSKEKLTLVESSIERRGTGKHLGTWLSGIFGMRHLGVNKGFAAIHFTHPKTNDRSIIAVAAHFAAHEGKADDREEDLRALKDELSEQASATVILAGDLNIRIANDEEGECSKDDIQGTIRVCQPPREQGSLRDAKGPRSESTCLGHYDYFMKLLKECDELRRNGGLLEKGKLLEEFQEEEIKFLPTFKLQKEPKSKSTADRYDEKRAPAWTDRVLMRLENGVSMANAMYQRNEKVHGSDHMPVYLRVKLNFQKK